MVIGYTVGKHTISARFQAYSGFPYTPVIDSDESPDNSGRYVPIYDYDHLHSKRFPWDIVWMYATAIKPTMSGVMFHGILKSLIFTTISLKMI